jgi:hypothetical protein
MKGCQDVGGGGKATSEIAIIGAADIFQGGAPTRRART